MARDDLMGELADRTPRGDAVFDGPRSTRFAPGAADGVSALAGDDRYRGGFTVLICGGRNFTGHDAQNLMASRLNEIEDEFGAVTRILHGGAAGADEFAGWWGKVSGIPVTVFPANWRKYGKRAGPLRNQRMINEGKPDLVVAFPGGRGTADMIARARNAGIRVVEVK